MNPDDRADQFHAFVLEHEPAVRAYAARRAHGPGQLDDVVQEALVVVWERFEHVMGTVDPTLHRAWTCLVARNVLRRHARSDQRRSARQQRAVADRALSTAEPREPFDVDVARREGVRRLLAGLNDDDREVLQAAYWDGFTTRELATLLDCSEAAARKRLSRALARLREQAASDEAEAR